MLICLFKFVVKSSNAPAILKSSTDLSHTRDSFLILCVYYRNQTYALRIKNTNSVKVTKAVAKKAQKKF